MVAPNTSKRAQQRARANRQGCRSRSLYCLLRIFVNYNLPLFESLDRRLGAVKRRQAPSFRRPFGEIGFTVEILSERPGHCLFPSALGLQDQFHHLPGTSVSASSTRYKMARGLQFRSCVSHRDCQPGSPGHRDIRQVVAHVSRFFFPHTGLLQAIIECGCFRFLAEVNEFHLQLLGALRHGRRFSPGNEARADPHDVCQFQSCAVLRVKSLHLRHSTIAGQGNEVDAAVRDGAVNIHKKQLDLLRAVKNFGRR